MKSSFAKLLDSLVVDAVLIVDVQKFVLYPADFLCSFLSCLTMKTVFLIKLSKTHHGFFSYSPLEKQHL